MIFLFLISPQAYSSPLDAYSLSLNSTELSLDAIKLSSSSYSSHTSSHRRKYLHCFVAQHTYRPLREDVLSTLGFLHKHSGVMVKFIFLRSKKKRMATTAVFTLAERIVMPFSAGIPVLMALMGAVVWRRLERQRVSLTEKFGIIDTACSAVILGQFLFHALPMVITVDPTFGMVFVGLGVLPMVWLFIFWKALHTDITILMNENAETADYVQMDTQDIPEVEERRSLAVPELKRRRVITVFIYLIFLLNTGLDGVFLVYNRSSRPSALLTGMFFLDKLLESVVMVNILLYARVRYRVYWMMMLNFIVAVGLSTLPVYNLVDPIIIVASVEHPAFRALLGVTGGILFAAWGNFQFVDLLKRVSPFARAIVFTVFLILSAIAGSFM
jgi:hypothetical protein